MNVLLGSFLTLQLAIAGSTDGWLPVVLLLISFVLLIIGTTRSDRMRGMEVALLLLFLIHAAFPPLLYGDSLNQVTSVISIVLAVLFVLQLSLFPDLRRVFTASALTLAALLYAMVPIASPAPRIDAFTSGQESAARLLEGVNPYAHEISDVYEGEKYFGYDSVPGYSYLPGSVSAYSR